MSSVANIFGHYNGVKLHCQYLCCLFKAIACNYCPDVSGLNGTLTWADGNTNPIVATDFPICDRPRRSQPVCRRGSLKVVIAQLPNSYNKCDYPLAFLIYIGLKQLGCENLVRFTTAYPYAFEVAIQSCHSSPQPQSLTEPYSIQRKLNIPTLGRH